MKLSEDELLEIGFSKKFIGQTDDNGNEIYFLEWLSGYAEYDLTAIPSSEDDEWEVYLAMPVLAYNDYTNPFQTVTHVITWIELMERYVKNNGGGRG